jgi:hypothetical protein
MYEIRAMREREEHVKNSNDQVFDGSLSKMVKKKIKQELLHSLLKELF